jgi:hypothetical protein
LGTSWTDELLDSLRLETDPVADDVVTQHFSDRPGDPPHTIFRHLVRSADVPAEARSDAVDGFLSERPPPPDWADPALVRRGELVFSQFAPEILTSLLFASLPEAYAAAKGVQVLPLTARLATDTKRRLVETTQMVVDVMSPGGLVAGAPGYMDARRVRLMHAAVRYLILNDPLVIRTCDPAERGPHWCVDWGEPVNQEDLLGTLMTFTRVIFESLDRLGVDLGHEDAHAYLHSWNIVGHLLGIRADLLPIDMASAVALTEAIRRRQYAPSRAGREMAAALVDLAESEMHPPGHGPRAPGDDPLHDRRPGGRHGRRPALGRDRAGVRPGPPAADPAVAGRPARPVPPGGGRAGQPVAGAGLARLRAGRRPAGLRPADPPRRSLAGAGQLAGNGFLNSAACCWRDRNRLKMKFMRWWRSRQSWAPEPTAVPPVWS